MEATMSRWFSPLAILGAILVMSSMTPLSLAAAQPVQMDRNETARDGFYRGGGRYQYRTYPRYYRHHRPRWDRHYNYPYRYRHYDRYYYGPGYEYYGPRGGVYFRLGI